jgi:glycosyltransferase involved in cell wall biosynthesis
MRFHVCALPHTNTTADYLACAYTAKVINFCRMMMDRGHEVFLYAGEENTAPCTECIPCVPEVYRKAHVGDAHFTSASFDYNLPFWQRANSTMAENILARKKPKDFLCLIGGYAQKQIADMLPDLMPVEFGVGYGGVFSRYRVFESYAWMHTVYGAQSGGKPHDIDGHWWDTVIPGYLDPDQFPFGAEPEDYFLFMGRLVDRKGFQIAVDVCADLKARLVVAGQGQPPAGCEYVGVVGPEERGRLMSRAKAVFVPTHYIEPFGNVNVEAQACGTPVITTDWGVFPESVVEGVTGFRCRTFGEFKRAAERVHTLDRRAIRDRAVSLYSLETIGRKYEEYFQRLLHLWADGWYEGRNFSPQGTK